MRVITIFIALVVIFASCSKDEPDPVSQIDVVFELLYDGEALSPTTDYFKLNDSVEVNFSKVSFYLSGFKVDGTDGLQDIPGVIILPFLQNLNGDVFDQNVQVLNIPLPASDYSSFSFGLGVTPTENATKPAQHEPGSPLSFASEYWEAWESYIFEKIEGTFKINEGEPETMALHIGGDETFRTLEWKDGFSLSGDATETVEVSIDLKSILEGYPLSEAPVLHSEEQLQYMEMLADRLKEVMN